MTLLQLMQPFAKAIWGRFMPSATNDLLRIEHFALGYDAPNILTDVNLSVASGEIIALVGQNGVGKTALLHAIMGFMPQVSGQVLFNGKAISQKRPYEIARLGIGLVKQENAVFSALRIVEHFALVNHLSLEENLRYFPDLLPKAKQRAKNLSGGQRQQLAVALALANQPQLLLLDEPSANIQPSVVESMIETLNTIRENADIAIIIAEQNLSVIQRLADKAYLMKAGRLLPNAVEIGTLSRAELAEQLTALGDR